MKEVYLYLCDSKRKMADGKCTGEGCCDVPSNYACRHTADSEYARYSKSFEDRIFEIIYLEDDTGMKTIRSYWEVDPQELS